MVQILSVKEQIPAHKFIEKTVDKSLAPICPCNVSIQKQVTDEYIHRKQDLFTMVDRASQTNYLRQSSLTGFMTSSPSQACVSFSEGSELHTANKLISIPANIATSSLTNPY